MNDTDAIRAEIDEPISVLGYRRRLQDALDEIDALRAKLAAVEAALRGMSVLKIDFTERDRIIAAINGGSSE